MRTAGFFGWVDNGGERRPVPHPPGFPVRPSGVNRPHAAFLKECRTRCHGWGRAVGTVSYTHLDVYKRQVHLHNPVLAYECGDDFMKHFYLAEEGKLERCV